MRIVFVIPPPNVSGGLRTVATYARLLAKRGHEVTVVSSQPAVPRLRTRVRNALLGRGPARSSAATHLDGSGIKHHLARSSGGVVDSDVPDADAVIATWWETAEWVSRLSPSKGAKVHFIQGQESDLPGQPKARVDATWRLPLHRIVCSEWLLHLARSAYRVESVTCVLNGVDLEQFSAPPREKGERSTVGFVYSDAWIKGCDVAVAAYEQARRTFPELRLVSFGGASPTATVPLPPGTEFVLLPEQPRIPRLYASCDVWLWPSRREGFGLPILEAMGCGTPVIAAPAGAAPELLEDGGGILLPSADASAMAAAIVEVLSLSGAEWRTLSDRARAVAALHGWDDSVRQFEQALELATRSDAARR